MRTIEFLRFCIFLGLFCLAITSASMAASLPSIAVAIIANPDVPAGDLSLAEIRKIFMGDRQYWTPSLPITLLVRAPVARERDVVLKVIYRMTEQEFRQYWIGKIFRAEVVSGPKIVYSTEMTGELVAQLPGGVSFVDADKIPKGVKVLRTNGLNPTDPTYPLR